MSLSLWILLVVATSKIFLISGNAVESSEPPNDSVVRSGTGVSHWCPKRYAESHPEHFMCTHGEGSDSGCKDFNYKFHNLTDYEKMAIVHLNNKLRQRVAVGKARGQPPAKNMMQITWNDQLAEFASRLTLQCRTPMPHAHMKIGVQFGDAFDVNKIENFNWHPRNQISLIPLMDTFVEDAYKPSVCQGRFKQTNLYPFYYDQNTGTYSYMMWGISRYIGCALLEYESKDTDVDFKKAGNALFICFYGPGIPKNHPVKNSSYVPYQKKRMYQAGSPDCATKSTVYPGLCLAEDQKKYLDPCLDTSFESNYPDLCNATYYEGLCGPVKAQPKGVPWGLILGIVSLLLLLVAGGLIVWFNRDDISDCIEELF